MHKIKSIESKSKDKDKEREFRLDQESQDYEALPQIVEEKPRRQSLLDIVVDTYIKQKKVRKYYNLLSAVE
jgi:hypothetical protein